MLQSSIERRVYAMNNKTTGQFIARCRKELNLSQKELAKKLNITDKAVSKWETGNGAPDISLLTPLAETLNVSVLEILNGEKLPEDNNEENINDIVIEALKSEKKKRLKSTIHTILTLLIIFSIVNLSIFAYWGRRHKVLYDVETVYVVQSDTIPEIYNLSYNVVVKNWWFDFIPHSYKLEDGLGGEPSLWHFEAETDYFTSNNISDCRFSIKVEFDTRSCDAYETTNIEEVIMMSSFDAFDKNENYISSANLYMNDFPDVEIIYM